MIRSAVILGGILRRTNQLEDGLLERLFVSYKLIPLLSFDHVGVFVHLVLANAIFELTPEFDAFRWHSTLLKFFLNLYLVDVYLGWQLF